MTAVASGRVAERPYGRLVYWLGTQRFSGRLVLKSADREYWIRYVSGQVVDAYSPDPAESLAKLALKSGLANSTQLSNFVAARRSRPQASEAELLAEAARLSSDQLAAIERLRIAHSAARTFALPDASFVCDAEQAEAAAGVITLEWVVYRGLREHYGDRRLSGELGALADHRIRLRDGDDERLASFGFDFEDEIVLDALRTEPREAASLIRSIAGDRRRALAVLYALWACDALDLIGDEAPRPIRPESTQPVQAIPAAAVAAAVRTARPAGSTSASPSAVQAQASAKGSSRVEVKRRKLSPGEVEGLIRNGLAILDRDGTYFELLGVSQGASSQELQVAYFKLAKQLHPDRVQASGAKVADAEIQRLFARVNLAFSTLSDAKKRSHYLEVVAAGGEAAYRRKQEEAEQRAADILAAEDHFLAGEMAMRRSQYQVAFEQFQKAVELNPEEGEHLAYYAWAAWMSSADRDAKYDDVMKYLRRALDLSPKCAPAHFFLGQLAKHKQRHKEALRYFEDVLKLQPGHNDAQLEVRLLRSRGLV